MMSITTTRFPNYSIGENVLMQLGEICSHYGRKVLVTGGKKALEMTKNKIEASLQEHDIQVVDFMWYGGDCTYKNINEIKAVIENESVELVIGVGGGKAIDTAKGAAEKASVPIVTIPTIAATCAATTALSIVYTEKGDFEDLFHLNKPPEHILMDSEIIAKAPVKFLWAGIGDTIAKYYEVEITTRGKELSHGAAMAKELSVMCVNPLIKYGDKALKDSDEGTASFALEQIILNNIISTGIVAMLVGQEHNGAAAHGLFYGFTLLEEIEKHHLHGEVVAYGVMVLLAMDGQDAELNRLYPFYKKISLPTCLKDIDVTCDRDYLENVLEKAVNAPDMQKMPYKVTKDMLFNAIMKLENFNQ